MAYLSKSQNCFLKKFNQEKLLKCRQNSITDVLMALVQTSNGNNFVYPNQAKYVFFNHLWKLFHS